MAHSEMGISIFGFAATQSSSTTATRIVRVILKCGTSMASYFASTSCSSFLLFVSRWMQVSSASYPYLSLPRELSFFGLLVFLKFLPGNEIYIFIQHSYHTLIEASSSSPFYTRLLPYRNSVDICWRNNGH